MPARAVAIGSAAATGSAKRDAVEQAARAVFRRLGYARAPIDQIATEAGVSTRTLYSHCGDKLGLFSHVLVHGATEVRALLEARLKLIASAAGVPLADAGAAARHLVALSESTLLTEPEGPRPPTGAELADAVAVFARGYGLTGPSASTPGPPASAKTSLSVIVIKAVGDVRPIVLVLRLTTG